MQKIETEHLEKNVRIILGLLQVEGVRGNYRCHEYARRIGDFLKIAPGYTNLTVNDGTVVYQASFLRKSWPTSDTLIDIHGRKLRHSWLEVDDVVVDFHVYLAFTLDSGRRNALFVHRKDDVVGHVAYLKNGWEVKILGRPFIYYSPRDFTRLRLDQ
ncbi:hypothetical protein A3B45_02175 [Candidatus Daviesbacteria bacterium RIFCSPLOWO2_01_FULL_39_12]|uniref:Uncharacterized protein n=1 Tax=Candidatus Daviesbacteria bacterium RIFCSPLOWO2_01_FULL_39_12 TaxID=1797785 RepID=A0A1F5KNH1_9BACT|nr:MAG: hypothetical protein A3B45_02175 [Candidatus Daviesbacteria bacterium RIFCSPLOWO2_01_FULL_39_12]